MDNLRSPGLKALILSVNTHAGAYYELYPVTLVKVKVPQDFCVISGTNHLNIYSYRSDIDGNIEIKFS